MKKIVSFAFLIFSLIVETMFSSIALSQADNSVQASSPITENESLLKLLEVTKVSPLNCEGRSHPTSVSIDGELYTVREGDYLSTIVEGKGFAPVEYREIRDYNNEKAHTDDKINIIHNDNLIYPGWTIFIPSRSQLNSFTGHNNSYGHITSNIPFGDIDSISIGGSATVYLLTVRAAECYRQSGFMGEIKITSTGTIDGINQLCQKQIDIADASNEPNAQEIKDAGCNDTDNKLIKLQVAVDAVAIYFNTENSFFKNDPDNISLDITHDLPYLFNAYTKSIHKYLPSLKSGTLSFLTEKMHAGLTKYI